MAKVKLDAETAQKLESTLRTSLSGASAINVAQSPTLPVTNPTASVELDADAVARFTEHLRSGLVSAQAINVAQSQAVDKTTGTVKPSGTA